MSLSNQNSGIGQLIEKAKSDAAFFHELIWNTEAALKKIDFLSESEKQNILSISSQNLIGGLATGFESSNLNADCGGTCGASCGASCGATCGASCGGSCGASCAATCALSSLLVPDQAEVIYPSDTIDSETKQKITDEINKQRELKFSVFKRK